MSQDANFAHSCLNPGDCLLLKSHPNCRNLIPVPTFLTFGKVDITGGAAGYVRLLSSKQKTRNFEKIQGEKKEQLEACEHCSPMLTTQKVGITLLSRFTNFNTEGTTRSLHPASFRAICSAAWHPLSVSLPVTSSKGCSALAIKQKEVLRQGAKEY